LHGAWLGCCSTSIALYMFNKLCCKQAELENLAEFIKNWPRNKKHSPISLHTIFDDLYELYKEEEGKTEELHNEMCTKYRVIKEELSGQFPGILWKLMKYIWILPRIHVHVYNSK
jgi:hypothetical protein